MPRGRSPAGDDAARRARQRRARAARRFKPDPVKLLLIAEAPPAALERYFYFTDVRAHDSLFRHVAEAILRRDPTRENKAELLTRLRDRGVYLIDLKLDPVDGTALSENMPSLLRRVRRLRPARIVLIKASVYDTAYGRLRAAGLPVVNERVPFPGSGQQAKFRGAFARARRARVR